MSHPLFAVSRFKNRNGVYSFRVAGRRNGVRIRRNFKTQEEAAAEKATLELKAMQAANLGLQSAACPPPWECPPAAIISQFSPLEEKILFSAMACRTSRAAQIETMSTVTEIEAAIERLSPPQVRELADWLTDRLIAGETPAMLAALNAGTQSLESEPTVPAEDVRKKIRAWTNG
jgi:hypothetical protein